MRTPSIESVGFDLHLTAKLPTDAQVALARRHDNPLASFGLTPNWGELRGLSARKLRQAGAELPAHWGPNDQLFATFPGLAFYIVPDINGGGAVSFSMFGVNLRTGRPEGPLTDEPTQSYWTSRHYTPWIDGYVPSDGAAVRQFVPLRGEREMRFDISDGVGVAAGDPLKDAISAAFYLPREWQRQSEELTFRGGSGGGGFFSSYTLGGSSTEEDDELEGLLGTLGGSSSPKSGADVFLGAPTLGLGSRAVERVGMGAGARMRQDHALDPSAKVTDFAEAPFIITTARLVWFEQYNLLAKSIGEQGYSEQFITQIQARQQTYENDIRARLGLTNPNNASDVDTFPVPA